MGRLESKVAIITGAGAGIGEAVAKKFAAEGAAVLIAGLPDDPLEAVMQDIQEAGRQAAVFAGDLAFQEQAEDCVARAVEDFGRVDVLVNNAGMFPATAELQDYPPGDFEKMMRANTHTVFHMSRAALPELHKTRGNIVCTGSGAGLVGIANNTPYGGTKAWIHSFARGLAVEQAPHGVRVNCVCPGAVDTAWTHQEQGPFNAQMEKMVVQATPLGRRATAEEIANVFAFVASDEASYMTGSLVFVDGGITIAKGPVGDQVPEEIARPPQGKLDLKHTWEGLEHKTTRQKI
ncbi:MAG: SDR family NAD(P)-dependent oxidoreductase [Phycisphaeraceae bacterium]